MPVLLGSTDFQLISEDIKIVRLTFFLKKMGKHFKTFTHSLLWLVSQFLPSQTISTINSPFILFSFFDYKLQLPNLCDLFVSTSGQQPTTQPTTLNMHARSCANGKEAGFCSALIKAFPSVKQSAEGSTEQSVALELNSTCRSQSGRKNQFHKHGEAASINTYMYFMQSQQCIVSWFG